MTSRFVSNLIVVVLGAVLMPARFVFGGETVRWIAFGAGVLGFVVVAAAFLYRGRGPVQRTLDIAAWLAAAWTAVSALAYARPVVGWLGVGEGAALAALALVGLVAHEMLMERAFRGGRSVGDIERDLAAHEAQRPTEIPVAS